jgi:hypothetical protein
MHSLTVEEARAMTQQELADALAQKMIDNICEGYEGGLETWAYDTIMMGDGRKPLSDYSKEELLDMVDQVFNYF